MASIIFLFQNCFRVCFLYIRQVNLSNRNSIEPRPGLSQVGRQGTYLLYLIEGGREAIELSWQYS